MTAPKKSKYAGVAAARAQRAASYFQPGSHILVRILKVEEGEDRFRTPLVAIQTQVVYAFGDNEASGNTVGQEVSEVIKSTNVAYMPRLKAVAMAIGNLTETDFSGQAYDGEIFEELVSDGQPGAGVIVEVRTTRIRKQAAQGKSDDQLVDGDFYTRTDFVRRLSFAETNEVMTAAGLEVGQINRLVPNIEAEIEAEAV